MKLNIKIKRKAYAFTLAEVLITLGIIGVVAAMTLPTLIQNNRNKELQTGLKRSYSIISQALDMYQAEYGERIKADGSLKNLALGKYLKKYLKVIKDCGYAHTGDSAPEASQGCVPNSAAARQNGTFYKTFNSKSFINLDPFDDSQFILNDGSIILIENPGEDEILHISVDVNGYKKKPNRLGQDLFMFQIDKDGKLLPMGLKGTAYYSETDEHCSKNSSSNMNGAGCTYKALSEKDYFKNL